MRLFSSLIDRRCSICRSGICFLVIENKVFNAICMAAPPISSIHRWQRSLIPTQDALQSFQMEKTLEDAKHFVQILLYLASRKNHQPQAYLRTAHPVHFSMAMIGMDRGTHNAGMNSRT